MSDDLEVESVTEEIDEPDRQYYVDRIDDNELRRYVCLDLARMCEAMPKDVVKIARDMEAFLLGRGVRGAVE